MPDIWNLLFLILWLTIPIVIFIKLRGWKGFLLATFYFYMLGILEGIIMSASVGDISAPVNGPLLIIGVPTSLLYVSVTFFFFRLFKKLKKIDKLFSFYKKLPPLLGILALTITIFFSFVVSVIALIAGPFYFTAQFGRIGDFQPFRDGQKIPHTSYFFKFAKSQSESNGNYYYVDTDVLLKNTATSSALTVNSFPSTDPYKDDNGYTTFTHKGRFYLITKSPNQGSGSGDYYDIYDLSAGNIPRPTDSLVTKFEENRYTFLKSSCTFPKLVGDSLEFTTQGHCDNYPFSFGGEKQFTYQIPLN